MDYNTGDIVEVTFKAKATRVASPYLKDEFTDSDGKQFLMDRDSAHVTIKVVAPSFEDGAYMDYDGEMFKRYNGQWFSFGDSAPRYVSVPTQQRLKLVTLPYDDVLPW